MIRILLVLIGYICGLFQTGFLLGKIIGVDLKKQGSGNTGATNALRVLGIKGGILVFLLDALKAFIPCMVVRMIFRGQPEQLVYVLYTALGAVLGNNFPFYLKFKGGKGVAATCGWGFAMDWRLTLICLAFFFLIAVTTRYVSLASCLVTLVIVISYLIFNARGLIVIPAGHLYTEALVLIIFLSAMILIRHKSNIKRLLNGTENRFGSKK